MWRARAWIGSERSRARVLVGRCAHRRAGCDPPMLQYARLVRAPRVVNAARNRLYHDYIRYATPGAPRAPSSPRVHPRADSHPPAPKAAHSEFRSRLRRTSSGSPRPGVIEGPHAG